MALLDVFKKKKPERKKPEKKVEKKVKATPRPARPRPVTPRPVTPRPAKPKKVLGSAFRILKSPHVTEKATALTGKNQYIFKVFTSANKNEIKKSIEGLYGVDVASVRIINVHKKRRRLGRREGFRKGYKKAIVKIKKGQKIEVLPR